MKNNLELFDFKWSVFCNGYGPNHTKYGPFKIQKFLSGFQMFFGKLVAICLDYKWLGLQISDPIQNPDHLKPNLFLRIWNTD